MKEFLPKSAAKMADCLMKRYGLLTSRWSYDYGMAWRGMEALYAMTGEKKYFDYIKDAMDTFVNDESGAIRDYTLDEFNLDYICNGRQLLYLYKATGDSGTKSATPTKCGWMGCTCPRHSMWNTA